MLSDKVQFLYPRQLRAAYRPEILIMARLLYMEASSHLEQLLLLVILSTLERETL